MNKDIKILKFDEFPALLKEITDPPKELFLRGELPSQEENKFLCVVGARKYTSYGKEVCAKLVSELAGYPVIVVSGLAIGIDSIAHKTALDVGLKTIAIPGSGLEKSVIYPSMHKGLAEKIVADGGALLSEFEPDFKATPWGFPQRNRIMAGISHAVLVIEAEKRSGTLITSRLALEYNRDVMTVPGSVFSKNSEGPHMLIRLGATPVTCGDDILEVLKLKKKDSSEKFYSLDDLSEEEKLIIQLLKEPLEKDELIREMKMPVAQANILLSTMELKGIITEEMGKVVLNIK